MLAAVSNQTQGASTPSTRAASSFWPDRTVVSLFTVLSDAHVLNNLTELTTQIAAFRTEEHEPLCQGTVWTYNAPAWLMSDEVLADADCTVVQDDNLRATPEKAFVDWLTIASISPGALSPPPLDTDLDELDMTRLARLATRFGVGDDLVGYLGQKARHDGDEVKANSGEIWRELSA